MDKEIINEAVERVDFDFNEIFYFLKIAKEKNDLNSVYYRVKQIKENCLYIKIYCTAILYELEKGNFLNE